MTVLAHELNDCKLNKNKKKKKERWMVAFSVLHVHYGTE